MRVLLSIAVLAAVAAGCGTPSPDLFVVTRSGSVAGANLTLLIGDGGTVRCNGGAEREITSKQLIAARLVLHDLENKVVTNRDSSDTHDGPLSKSLSLPPQPRSIFSYRVRAEDGSVRFSDNSKGQPPVFYRLALLTRELAKGPCGLPR
jgi:hypothetical protein